MNNPIQPLFAWSCAIARRAVEWSMQSRAGHASPSMESSVRQESAPQDARSGTAAIHAQPIAYPSIDPGLPAKSIDAILEANADILTRIKLCYGADQASFERELLPLIQSYARFVHLLPATPDNYFAEAGGLLRLGLEVGFFALQGTDGHIFSGRATITARKHLEPRWRLATFIAGLCGEIHLAVGRLLVTDSDGAQWAPYLSDLANWLTQQRTDRYFLKWLPPQGGARALGLFALRYVVSPQTLQYLASNNTVIVPHLLASIAGVPMCPAQGLEHNVLDDLVKRAFALVVDRDLRASADRLGRPQLGSHVERYLLDAMRRLVLGGAAWTPNTERSRLWLGSDGLYLIWPQAASDIRKLLDADQIPGIPKAAETLAELLVQAGIAVPRSPQNIAWSIAPPPGKAVLEALRMSSPALLLAGLPCEPTPLAQRLEAGGPEAPPASPETTAMDSASGDLPEQGPASPVPSQSPNEKSKDRAGQQLSLLDENGEAGAGPTASGDVEPRYELVAPMRLEPNVRAALAAAVSSMSVNRLSTASDVGVRTVPTGVFVPLREFECRGVEPPTAVRVLAELSMLADSGIAQGPSEFSRHRANGPSTVAARCGKTVMHDFGGTEVLGVILLPRFIMGLDPACFAAGTPC